MLLKVVRRNNAGGYLNRASFGPVEILLCVYALIYLYTYSSMICDWGGGWVMGFAR